MDIAEIYEYKVFNKHSYPLFQCVIPAGIPTYLDDFFWENIDLNDLVDNPVSTFFMRVEGFSMQSAGINDGDLIIVDRSLDPEDESVVVAALNGEFIIRRLNIYNGRTFLISDEPNLKPIEIYLDTDFEIHGVVTYSISKHF